MSNFWCPTKSELLSGSRFGAKGALTERAGLELEGCEGAALALQSGRASCRAERVVLEAEAGATGAVRRAADECAAAMTPESARSEVFDETKTDKAAYWHVTPAVS